MNIVFFLDVVVLIPLAWSFYLLWRERKILSLRPIIWGIIFLFMARISEVLTEHPTFHISNYLNLDRQSFDLVMSITGNFADVLAVLFLIMGFIQTIRSHHTKEKIIHDLESLLPLCSKCKFYRTVDGTWHPIEQYLKESGAPTVTHSLCPACASQMLEVARSMRKTKEMVPRPQNL
jgi:hypothetical protein